MSRRLPPAPSGRAPVRGAAPGVVRIIGGRWRGTRLPVADVAGLRPTSDRVRETLFNWLMPALPGARVLDLFAGSGALGLEALSRGAAEAVLVERDPGAATALRGNVARLGAPARVVEADALRWLGSAESASMPAADIVFIDPPFAAGLWDGVLQALPARMAADAWLYVESPAGSEPAPPPGWQLHRELRTAQARAALYRGRGTGGADTLGAANPAP
ncbi:methyltransferase [Pseudoxanthomonas suwonensis 11-1]|uniref:Ribosomal RNA small subunit methyltransferase D n=1 Tax=Pseudoxanthomonas suwonensis (strain 11-1) TaxID=743721 RepID=E6WS91_PSEUU|nr:16S rRNA (guanine(966)-N(2))-methyltransferase RsmD [Pseudoxanthomonas suwonensis]ADV27040.1 methyltransferase [Pseudoxanthomonas suwonensis 11-1]